jgi:hypothetical protein
MKLAKDILAVLGAMGFVLGIAWGAMKFYQRAFTSAEIRMETEKFMQEADLNKVYGEYILDSIEEVQMQAWRRKQEVKDSITFKRLHEMDSLIRLGVYLSNKAAKATDTLNMNIEHTLEHVDQ